MSPTPARVAPAESIGTHQSERRLHQRYPIKLDVEYKLLYRRRVQREGFCRTVNIGSRGVLLDLKDALQGQGSIELSIKWPLLLEHLIPLSLMVSGKIVRNDGNSIAVKFLQLEFHTTSSRC